MNYSSKSRNELLLLCREKNIRGVSGKKKEELVAALSSLDQPVNPQKHQIKYVDLFAGIGGFRYGIQAFQAAHPQFVFECVKSADIKKDAIQTYNLNFNEQNQSCDVRTLKDLPHFDLLCGGFPCQPFSSAGKQRGLKDEGRGDLIYEVIRICKESKPEYILLENVSNIENIEKGEVLKSIVKEFQTIGYSVTCVPVNSSQVGLAQDRKRIFIVGCRSREPQIKLNQYQSVSIKDILDLDDQKTTLPEGFLNKLLSLPKEQLIGKSIKDKRGGDSNIHSWEIDFHGTTSERQKTLMNRLLLERRKKKWAAEKKIKWMDGIPLSLEDIQTFLKYEGLQEDLEDLVSKKYLVKEYPKDIVNGKRVPNEKLAIGYNIAKGKLSFPISKILHPDELSPTLTATDSSKLAVYVNGTIRQLNEKELKRLCGFPESLILPPGVNKYDLFGNMVCPPVVTAILESLLPPSV